MTTEQNKKSVKSDEQTTPDPSIETQLDLSIIQSEELNKFLPKNFPLFLKDGREPLRRQIYNNKKILKTVLTKPKKGVYMCNHCDQIFNNFGELLDHFDLFQVKRPHKCSHDDCPWSIVGFNRIRQLNRHENSVHTIEKGFNCKIPNCNKKFGRIDLLNRHIKSVHENRSSRFNKKMNKEFQQLNPTTSTSSPGSNSSDESPSDLDYTQSPIPSSSSMLTQENTNSQEISNQRRGSNIKHTIKFLTNSDE